jgi:hypothetical protein
MGDFCVELERFLHEEFDRAFGGKAMGNETETIETKKQTVKFWHPTDGYFWRSWGPEEVVKIESTQPIRFKDMDGADKTTFFDRVYTMVLLSIGMTLLVGFWVYSSAVEADTFSRVTGTRVSTWDAMFNSFTIVGSPDR